MDGIETSILLLVLLGACLVALILVLVARREAAAVRTQAREDTSAMRAELREKAADVARRVQRTEAGERQLARDRERFEACEAHIGGLEKELAVRATELDEAAATHEARVLAELEAVAQLSAEQARRALEARMLQDASRRVRARAQREEARIRQTADETAARIVADATARIAGSTSAETAVTVVPLPSADLKGPIIGKEGRNIRTFEAVTGVDLIVDESSDHVLLSCFDPGRREVARIALQQLIADGRINPERIERAYAEAVTEADDAAQASGQAAADAAGVDGLPPELLELVGRLRLRTSYGQNVQAHLVESALIAATIAAEVGAGVEIARRGAFLHDIGKAVPASRPGSHAAVGADLARRHGEGPEVVNAIAAHHDEVPAETVEAVLVRTADALSASRPGARRDDVAAYVERMENIERLVADRPGVAKVLAMAAGREIRVVVEPHEVADEDVQPLAHAIADDITAELNFPGQVSVTVVRELRARAVAG